MYLNILLRRILFSTKLSKKILQAKKKQTTFINTLKPMKYFLDKFYAPH